MNPRVSIIILNWNGWRDTIECMESVLKIAYPNYRVLIVDNGSTDDSVKMLSEKFPAIEILQTRKNLGYTGGNNRGIEKALADGAEYVFILNNDTVVDRDFLNPLVEVIEKDEQIGIVSGMIYNYALPHTIQYAGRYTDFYTGNPYAIGSGMIDKGQFKALREVQCAAGAAMLVRSDVLREVGMFNENFFMFSEESDLSIRAKEAGYKIVCVSESKIYHKIGASICKNPSQGVFYSLRNRIWIERMYASKFQYLIFNLYFWFYLLPRIFMGHILRRRFQFLKVTIKAVWRGYFESPW